MLDVDTDIVNDIYNSQEKNFEREKFSDTEYSNREEYLKKCIEDLRDTLTPDQKPIMERLLGAMHKYDEYAKKKRFGNGMKYMYELGVCLKNRY